MLFFFFLNWADEQNVTVARGFYFSCFLFLLGLMISSATPVEDVIGRCLDRASSRAVAELMRRLTGTSTEYGMGIYVYPAAWLIQPRHMIITG